MEDFSLEGSLHTEFLAIASSGLEYHLAQAGSEERDVGMIIAQMILNKLRPDAENKLNFEFSLCFPFSPLMPSFYKNEN